MKPLSIKALKLTLLAATAGVFASAAHAAAPETAPTAPPIIVASEAPPAHASDEPQINVSPAAKAAGFAALLAGALALGIRLIGRKRLEAAIAFARPLAEKALAGPAKVIKAVGASMAAPFRVVGSFEIRG